MSKKWLDSGCLRAQPESVDSEAGIITGVKVCTEGEAKGHGVHLDREFIETVSAQGGALSMGLKSRFGHPTMCSEALGTYLGRFKNFSTTTTIREDGSEAATCIADLHLSDTARETPNGDLHSYITSMAEKEADVFGTSIVFTPGKTYRKDKETGAKAYRHVRETFHEVHVWYSWEENDRVLSTEQENNLTEELFIECDKLHACDCVDDPAANDGLFSAFSGDLVAAQITEFLDLHPQVFSIITDNPQIVAAIAGYGDKFDQFLTRYREYRKTSQEEATMPEKVQDQNEDLQEVAAPESTSAPETDGPETQEELSAVDEAVNKALKADRKRQSQIRELGKKFGFTMAAEQFAAGGQSVEEFRTHILNKSPEDWRASLAIKNPTVQQLEDDDNAEGAAVVDKVKQRRQERYGK